MYKRQLLAEYGAYVVGEQTIKVEHCLCALPGTALEDITDVYSHEQGFSQSEDFLARYEGWKQNAVLNTAAAAQLVAVSGARNKAAICSRRAARLFGLEVLRERINTSADNYTRFFVVSKTMELRLSLIHISTVRTPSSTPEEVALFSAAEPPEEGVPAGEPQAARDIVISAAQLRANSFFVIIVFSSFQFFQFWFAHPCGFLNHNAILMWP